MPFVGTLEQLYLSDILKRIELKQATGLLTIAQGEQKLGLYLKQGKLTYISSLHENAALGEKLLKAGVISRLELIKTLFALNTKHSEAIATNTSNHSELQLAMALIDLGIVSRERLDEYVIQEATRLLQELLSWPTGEVLFEEGVQPPTDRFLFCLRSTPVILSLMNTTSTSILPISGSKPIKDEPSYLVPALPTLKTPIPFIAKTPFPNDLTTKLSITRKKRNYFLRWEVLLIVAILLIAAFVHSINMFHFPYFEDDEGTYMSQAWAVVHLGRLAYYTYWYDHAPAGWILIAIWTIITGGFHTFGPTNNSGRVLMLLMQVGSTFMLYRIARSISGNVTVAVIASLLFALSPYGIYFHRRVLLDNITTFWMLLSILLLVSDRLSLKRVWLSAVAISLSILSKEVTVFLVPVLTYLVFFRADKSHRWIATIGWIACVSCLVSLYPLMAIINNELFPTGTLLGGTSPHVSLLGTVQYQASRGRDGGLFNPNSGFWLWIKVWIQDDSILVVVGSLCAVLSLLAIRKRRLIAVMGLVTLSLWAFMARGGEIIDFYLVPLLPLLALNVGLLLGLVAEQGMKFVEIFMHRKSALSRSVEQIIIIICLVGIVVSNPGPSMGAGFGSSDISSKSNPLLFWNGTQADAQIQATLWIEKNLPPGSRMIIDESMWTDLYDGGFRLVHYYWKVEDDPAIRDKIFHNSWRNFDYVATTPQMLNDMQREKMTLVEAVVNHSTPIASFDTGGWTIIIRKVSK